MVIDHLSLGINDVERARAFYDPVLAVLGLRCLEANAKGLDYGVATFVVSLQVPANGQPATPGNGVHVAFAAKSRVMVDTFYRLALENNGSDAGPPGLRPQYDPNYYGAFVRDPDGNKIEAMTYAAT